MKKFERIILILIAVALFGILGTLFIKKININRPVNKYLTLDDINIRDRENGICAGMYKEAFDWGVAQYKINFATFNLSTENLSETQRAVQWYNHFKNNQ